MTCAFCAGMFTVTFGGCTLVVRSNMGHRRPLAALQGRVKSLELLEGWPIRLGALFHEEGHPVAGATLLDVECPAHIHRARTSTGFPADDDPIKPRAREFGRDQVQVDRSQERLTRQ